MKQFFKIFRFEFRNYYTNKVFVFLTLFLVVAIGIGLSVPALASLFSSGSPGPAQDRPVMAVVSDTPEHGGYLEAAFSESFPGYRVELKDLDAEGLKAEVLTGVSACGFFVRGFSELDYCVMDLSIYDDNLSLGTEALRQAGLRYALHEQGLSDSEIEAILDLEIRSTATVLGTAQFQNYFYTYIMIFALYMVIVLYGNMVATNVASEKSSRAMELLITTAHPQSLMFGKIMASCMAGLTQLALVFGSSLLFYRLNETHWGGMPIVSSIFNMPLSLFLYMILFFLLGFLMYACLYAAIGSTVFKHRHPAPDDDVRGRIHGRGLQHEQRPDGQSPSRRLLVHSPDLSDGHVHTDRDESGPRLPDHPVHPDPDRIRDRQRNRVREDLPDRRDAVRKPSQVHCHFEVARSQGQLSRKKPPRSTLSYRGGAVLFCFCQLSERQRICG